MSRLAGRRVLVTGGAGFIGSHLTQALISEGARVRVADNLERGALERLGSVMADIEFHPVDLRDPSSAKTVCEGVDDVVHLASKVGGIRVYVDRPADVMLANVAIDTAVFSAAIRTGIKRLVYASSAHVYPRRLVTRPGGEAIREEDAYPADPPVTYGWAKLFGERQLEAYAEQSGEMHVATLRLNGIYGEGQDIDLDTGSLIPVLARRAVEWPHTPFVVLGTGEETRCYCYVGDAVEAIVRALVRLRDTTLLGPVNVGSEMPVSVAELVNRVIAISGKAIVPEWDPSRRGTIRSQTLDCSRSAVLLEGWTAETPLELGLRRVYGDVQARVGKGAATC